MFRKILIGMIVFLMACSIAAAGYQFGQYLAQRDGAGKSTEAVPGTKSE